MFRTSSKLASKKSCKLGRLSRCSTFVALTVVLKNDPCCQKSRVICLCCYVIFKFCLEKLINGNSENEKDRVNRLKLRDRINKNERTKKYDHRTKN